MEATFVLTIEAVQDSIAALRARAAHPFFPAYLHLRQRAAAEGRLSDLRPDWNALSTYLQVKDAPSSHPHFRPFTTGQKPSVHEWLNSNLAGSYAPSSLRVGQPPMRVVEFGSKPGTLSLREGHWELAREHLLGDVTIPLWALAGFMLRDFGFETDEAVPPGYADLEAGFVETFGYNDANGPTELAYLYDHTPHIDQFSFELLRSAP